MEIVSLVGNAAFVGTRNLLVLLEYFCLFIYSYTPYTVLYMYSGADITCLKLHHFFYCCLLKHILHVFLADDTVAEMLSAIICLFICWQAARSTVAPGIMSEQRTSVTLVCVRQQGLVVHLYTDSTLPCGFSLIQQGCGCIKEVVSWLSQSQKKLFYVMTSSHSMVRVTSVFDREYDPLNTQEHFLSR